MALATIFNRHGSLVFLIMGWLTFTAQSKELNDGGIGKQWAVLVAGSSGYYNYRHQADVCHAYQILRKGGLKDENIIVFMYDDIAFNIDNPRPGILINKPNGPDVYHGVPKDYTGENCTAKNFYAAILANKTALSGGSGKVVDSGPHDHIFIYYADHGSAGLIGMPVGDEIYAKDLIDVLEKKHHARTYKSMVLYFEACESGSLFEGILPSNLSIYAVTASNSVESSYATYCPPDSSSPSPLLGLEYDTCLGDTFSISWLEDSDLHDLRKETLQKQYQVVRRRTAVDTEVSSHVLQFGDLKLTQDSVFVYMGTNPENENFTFTPYSSSSSFSKAIDQRDAGLLHFRHKYYKAPQGSNDKAEARKKLENVISHKRHVDQSIHRISTILFGEELASQVLNLVRPSGQALVDDWNCLKLLIKAYEKQCGDLSWYGRKYSRAIANMCNAGVNVEQMTKASTQACTMNNATSNINN